LKKLTIGFSPCPNDTFIFDALVNKKIDGEGLEFEAVLEDIETLNQLALEGKLDLTKLSYPAFFQVIDKYILLHSGGALGKGVGPLLISKSVVMSRESGVENSIIALPGKNTTANMLFSFTFPNAQKKVFMRFDEIEDFVLSESSKAPPSEGFREALGVIIHENRFTYQLKGLHKVMDLGEYWEEKTEMPVPLGGIAIKRSIDKLISMKTEVLIRKSIEYAFARYPSISDYVKFHSQTMSEEVMRKHIDLYVNDFSISLGLTGKHAIEKMFEIFMSIQSPNDPHQSSSHLFLS
jgi:1,4-dihydroxy-6-naphthoate synthase